MTCRKYVKKRWAYILRFLWVLLRAENLLNITEADSKFHNKHITYLRTQWHLNHFKSLSTICVVGLCVQCLPWNTEWTDSGCPGRWGRPRWRCCLQAGPDGGFLLLTALPLKHRNTHADIKKSWGAVHANGSHCGVEQILIVTLLSRKYWWLQSYS